MGTHGERAATRNTSAEHGGEPSSAGADVVVPAGPEVTVRALATGAALGVVFSACNVYVGLKIGSTIGASIAAALLGFFFWRGVAGFSRAAGRWGVLENNINQTACSAAASAASAGLVAPLPALTLLTGQTLSWPWMALWVFSVMLVGIVVAIPLRRTMIEDEKLPFAPGVATAEMLRELHARGRGAGGRLLTLLAALVASGGLKAAASLRLVHSVALPGTIGGHSLRSLGFSIIPMPLLVGVGGLIGFRTCWSLLLGAVVAYGVIVPQAIHTGMFASPRSPEVRQWLLWPGVTLVVVGSLVSMCFSWRSVVGAFRWSGFRSHWGVRGGRSMWLWLCLGGVLALSVVLQDYLFGIGSGVGVLAVLLTFGLAMVAGRVSGETGVGMVGPMGKVAQLAFGFTGSGSPVPNLMAANVAGGAASQCADLLNDFKCGQLLGASPRAQTLAQVVGAVVGAAAGAAAYLALIPDGAALERMIGGGDWPMPAVKTWKAVAMLLAGGGEALPAGANTAMLVAGGAAVMLGVLERLVPSRWRWLVPSSLGVGLAFVMPAGVAVVLFLGGLIALLVGRLVPSWRGRNWVALCAGLITGESLVGIGFAVARLFR